MDIPIIIYHLGYKDYVTCCLKQALKYNNNVILITDAVNEYSNIDVYIKQLALRNWFKGSLPKPNGKRDNSEKWQHCVWEDHLPR